jgi:DNA-binding MarR family transcriptional regulator
VANRGSVRIDRRDGVLSAVKDNRTFPTMGTSSTQTMSSTANGERAVERSMNAVRSVVRALRINTRAIESKMGISLAQLFVLQQLADRPANSLNELAERTATHQSSVSVVVRRLVDNGYVSRTTSAHDKRRIEIDVTPTGRNLLAGAPTTIQLQLVTALRRMSAKDQTMLADLLERWLRDANIDIASPPMLGDEEINGDQKVS